MVGEVTLLNMLSSWSVIKSSIKYANEEEEEEEEEKEEEGEEEEGEEEEEEEKEKEVSSFQ